ncbi:MAG: Bax inhibitor-1/YccA family protein [Muribaculaceae bacterium]|nr:Bax inhibitor-1/YccA family protein [Muribaculaceae bacterium]
MYDNQFSSNTNDFALASRVSAVMKRVYIKMTLALIVTGLVAWLTSTNAAMLNLLYANRASIWVLALVEVGLVLFISARLNKISNATATALFYLFAVVNGLTLSFIFIAYTQQSIANVFFITAGTFGAMSAYGYLTNRDLSRMGSFLIMALIGLIIASVVNIFMHSEGLYWIISIVGVLLFVGLTAWDTQQVKRMAEMAPAESLGKIATIGALSLYLDFINLFIYLLRILGNRN